MSNARMAKIKKTLSNESDDSEIRALKKKKKKKQKAIAYSLENKIIFVKKDTNG